MIKCRRIISLALIIVICIVSIINNYNCNIIVANDIELQNEELINSFDENNYLEVAYTYDNLYSKFTYNDSMLFHDANVLSTDVAKFSVALAMAAYDKDKIESYLIDMGCDVVSYNYAAHSTYEYNDFVAFSIGKKTITYQNKEYNAYFIPVRGTKKNPEWYSNFNLGKRSDGYHEGFKLAADEILTIVDNVVDTENNIFIITGHSRGASVANIVAGELSMSQKYAPTENIFAYTFACPAVRKNINVKLNNIRNYQNPGDVIASIPLKDWNYETYGIDIELNTESIYFENFKSRFKTVYGETYQGQLETDSFINAFKSICAEEETFHTEENQLLFELAAYLLGGHTNSSPIDIFLNHDVIENGVDIFVDIIENAKSIPLIDSYDNKYNKNSSLLADIIDALNIVTDETFYDWSKNNIELINKIYNETNISVNSRDDLVQSKEKLETMLKDVSYLGPNLINISNLFCKADCEIGVLKDFINHAHTQETYVLWINTMYFGYEGWIDNGDITEISFDEKITHIGSYCFKNCIYLENIVIPTQVNRVGIEAFNHCESLTNLVVEDNVDMLDYLTFANCNNLNKIKMPIDLKYAHVEESSSFYNDKSVNEITYTKGKTGVMEDKSIYQNSNQYYCGSIEYLSKDNLTDVNFDECVEELGAYAFIENYKIKNVTGIENIKCVGDYAFNGCRDLNVDVSNIIEYGTNSFRACSSLSTINVNKNVEEIPMGCFETCLNVKIVNIPESVTSINQNAFNNCTSLEEVYIYNKDCEIYGSKYTINDTAVIYGWLNSTAKDYSYIYNREFVSLEAFGDNEQVVEVIEPTCTTDGYKLHYSPNYDIYWKTNYIEKYGHSFVFVKKVLPTNISEGYNEYCCSTCDYIEKRYYIDNVNFEYETGTKYDLFEDSNENGINLVRNEGVETVSSTGIANYAIDNDSDTRWESEYYDPQYIIIDLKQLYTIKEIGIRWEAAQAKDYTIEVSEDGINYEVIAEIENAEEIDNRYDKIVLKTASVGRYIKINGTARNLTYGYSIWEMAIYGNTLEQSDTIISDKIKVEGYQISCSKNGSRVVGSVEPSIYGHNVVSWGFIYAITELNDKVFEVDESDLFIDSDNDYVTSMESTENGTATQILGDSTTATYYVRTTLFTTGNSSEYTSIYKVRAYALLDNGIYVYSDVSTYSVFDIAEKLYQGRLMSSNTYHEYLYNNILSVVDADYTKLKYNWGNIIVKPGDIS